LRGFTCSAFGKVKVTTPCSIFALILLVSIEGSSLKVRRFSTKISRPSLFVHAWHFDLKDVTREGNFKL